MKWPWHHLGWYESLNASLITVKVVALTTRGPNREALRLEAG